MVQQLDVAPAQLCMHSIKILIIPFASILIIHEHSHTQPHSNGLRLTLSKSLRHSFPSRGLFCNRKKIASESEMFPLGSFRSVASRFQPNSRYFSNAISVLNHKLQRHNFACMTQRCNRNDVNFPTEKKINIFHFAGKFTFQTSPTCVCFNKNRLRCHAPRRSLCVCVTLKKFRVTRIPSQNITHWDFSREKFASTMRKGRDERGEVQ